MRVHPRSLGAHRTLKNLALLGSGLLVGSALFELGVRILDPQPAVRYCYSPDTFYAPVPGARFVYRRIDFAVPVVYNSAGMRDVERSLAKPPGSVRLALIGDSQVESKEVLLDSTFAQILERGFRRLYPAVPIEFLNFGVSGFGTVASVARYRTLASAFDPDLVVYMFMDNDLEDNLQSDRKLYRLTEDGMELRALPADRRTRAVRGAIDFLKRNFQSYAFLKFRLAELRSRGTKPGSAEMQVSVAKEATGEAWNVLHRALAALDESVRGSGASLLVVQAGTREPEMSRILRELCEEMGVPYFDLVAEMDGGAPVRYPHDGHWNAQGHRRAAAALGPWLQPRLQEILAARRTSLAEPQRPQVNDTGIRSGR